jgi:hypothetical protein
MYITRRGGFDTHDADLHYALLQKRKPKMVNVGNKVVLSEHKDAQVYTVTEVYSVTGLYNKRLMAKLMYVSEYGKLCDAGAADVSSLMMPSDEQLANL